MLKREYIHESLNYVLKIQEVQERIKFEFVEILLGFMSGWLVFYHLGHEVAEDAKEYMTDLQHKVQKVSDSVMLVLVPLLIQHTVLISDSRGLHRISRNSKGIKIEIHAFPIEAGVGVYKPGLSLFDGKK
jgi:hypothetical protein